jgi:Holliday junction resolvasome RuvABC DNA-binding subunit
MVTLANAQRKALLNLGYTNQQVNAMSLADTTQELKNLGYDFKANSSLKNK